MLKSVLDQDPKALLLLRLISYLPIALFAESLRVQSSVLSSICSSSSVTAPLTGCVKDLDRLWNLNLYELFGGFGSGREWIVISIRNGNNFPLVNQGLLELAGLKDKPTQDFASVPHSRPVTVAVKFVRPSRSSNISATSLGFWARHFVNSANAVLHLCLAVALEIFDIYTESLLMSCLFAIDFLQATLRHGTSAVFSSPLATDGRPIPVYGDGPLDV